MKQYLDDVYRGDPVKACRLALRRTQKMHWRDRMEAIDKLLRAYGVEGIRGEWQNGYWCEIVATYVNMGDTYAPTVLCVRGDWSGARPRFIVSSWGDWFEQNQEKYELK